MNRTYENSIKGSSLNYWAIGVISLVVPLLVAYILFNSNQNQVTGNWIKFLPHLHGAINSMTAFLLVLGFYFIKKGQVNYHKTTMISAFCLGAIFLVSYITYHSSAPPTLFGDLNHDGIVSTIEAEESGSLRVLYVIILLVHIVLALIVLPLVLLAVYFALNKKFEGHRKVVKFAWPIWLFVSVSGVVVYLMIRPYYA